MHQQFTCMHLLVSRYLKFGVEILYHSTLDFSRHGYTNHLKEVLIRIASLRINEASSMPFFVAHVTWSRMLSWCLWSLPILIAWFWRLLLLWLMANNKCLVLIIIIRKYCQISFSNHCFFCTLNYSIASVNYVVCLECSPVWYTFSFLFFVC